MNATTPFVLGAAPSTLLSRLDLSDPENSRDAAHQWRRCTTDADFARWARNWGGAITARMEETEGHDASITTDDLRSAELDAQKFETRLADLQFAVGLATKALDQIGIDFTLSANVEDAIGKVTTALETAQAEA